MLHFKWLSSGRQYPIKQWCEQGLARPTDFEKTASRSLLLRLGLCLSVCVCVCLSVTSQSSTKTAKRRITQTTPHDSPLWLTKAFISARIVNVWNSLPNSVVDACTVNAFKARLDRFWQHQSVKFEGKCKWSYGPSCPVDFPLNIFIHSVIHSFYSRSDRRVPETDQKKS